MFINTDILIIGAGPAGIVTATTARKYYPEKKILIVKNVERGVIPCGIPYMFYSLKNPEENELKITPLEKKNIQVIIDEVVNIDRIQKIAYTKNGDMINYEKLIMATGSLPQSLPIPGIEKEGVYLIYKDMEYLRKVVEKVKNSKNVLIIGGGFIGCEVADEISKIEGVNVYLVEVLPNLLANSFDPEFSKIVEEKLVSEGVKVLTNTKVVEIIGKEKVEEVLLSDGRKIKVDVVILGIGSVPNTELAQKIGLEIGKRKGIRVDEYMRTSDPNIFAVGDCAEKRDFFTRKPVQVMLASTATAESRICGANIYKLKVIRENKGTIAIYSTFINGVVLGSAGLTEKTANLEGFEIITGIAEAPDKHPKTLPSANKIKVKLIFSKHSGIILGGQVAGGMSCGELINLIGVAIQKRMSFTELETLQMATHPYLTPAPTMYPVVLAAQDAANKI